MRAFNRLFLVFGLSLTVGLAACGDDTGPAEDGGGPVGGAPVGGEGGGPTALEKPDAGINDCHADFMEDGVCRPSLSKCDPGTIPDIDEGCVAVGVPDCAPEFVDDRGICLPAVDACGAGTFPVPSLGCISIDGDTGCGTGKWGAVVEGAGDVHVDQSYALDDSDGTREKPFASIPAAMAAAADGNRIVIAEGSYEGAITVDRPLHFEGICASKVELTALETDPYVLTFEMQKGEVASVTGVAVQAQTRSVYVTGGHVDLERLHIHDVDLGVLVVQAGVVTVTRSLIEDIRENTQVGSGVIAQAGGGAEVSESAIIRARSVGVNIYDGGSLSATDVFVGSTLPDVNGNAELADNFNGEMTIERSVFARAAWGINVFGTGNLTIHDSVVAETSDSLYGVLVGVVDADSVASASRNVLANGGSAGIAAYAGEVHSSHNWITELSGGQAGSCGILQFVQPPGGMLTSEKDVITNVEMAGIWTTLPATIDGAVIEGVAYRDANGWAFGAGILVGEGDGAIDRSFVSGATDYGIFATGAAPALNTLSVARSRIEATTGVEGEQGVGIAVAGLTLELTATSIADVRGAGILITGASAEISTTIVSGVVESAISRVAFPYDGKSAPISDGLLFHADQAGHVVTLTDAWFEGYGDAGVVLSTLDHSLTRVRATGGLLGLALEDGATAEQIDCDFSGNSAAEQAEDAGAPLPP